MGKRKHTSYTVEQKLNAIQRIRNGMTKAALARELDVPESTLRGWVRDEEKLKNFIDTVDTDNGLARKRARTAQNTELDKCLY
jgi:transposase-like protein